MKVNVIILTVLCHINNNNLNTRFLSPQIGYLIEKRTPKGEWKQATNGLVTNPSAHLTGLEPGETYEFRVSAVNDAGPGRPSRATAPHVMKDPSCKSFFELFATFFHKSKLQYKTTP